MEKWKSIQGYEGYYEISNKGRVRSLNRTYNDSIGRTVTKKGREQKQYIRKNYYSVWLNKNNVSTPYSVHRLVAIHFLKKPYGKYFVNHSNISAIKRGKSWTEFAKTLRTEINKITESEVING